MVSFIMPLALVVLSNVFYQICAKSVPADMNPLASLTITYMVGAVLSLILYFILNKNANLGEEFSHLNFAPFLLGIVIVGLEVGYILAYKAGWKVSTAAVVQGAFLAIILVFVGKFVYNEPITWKKILGVVFTIVGLVFLNME